MTPNVGFARGRDPGPIEVRRYLKELEAIGLTIADINSRVYLPLGDK